MTATPPTPRTLLKRAARGIIFPAVEAAWTLLFHGTGLILRPRARRWASPGNRRVLVIAPHPDDETIGCGGVIALHARAGDEVHIIVATDGGASRAGGLSRKQIVALRSDEAETAVPLLGRSHLTQLRLPEGLWTHGDRYNLADTLAAHIRAIRPYIIYTTSCVDFHPEHMRVARALAVALAASGSRSGPCRVRVYEVQVPLTPLLVNLVAPIGEVAHLKRSALRAYRTQLAALSGSSRLARYQGALYRLGGPTEVFWDMSPEQFHALMADRNNGMLSYRGLRPRPFSDGLSWLVGTIRRIGAREVVEQVSGLVNRP